MKTHIIIDGQTIIGFGKMTTQERHDWRRKGFGVIVLEPQEVTER